MEKLEFEPSTDLSKMGIRRMRKDDLVLVSSSSRGSRSPENFQMQFKQIRLSSAVKQVLSVAVDLTGFRVLCDSNASSLGRLLNLNDLQNRLFGDDGSKTEQIEWSSTGCYY
ncbi:unnamed protein product [Meloidogyne enterolobii]|uniref:Uncharacterized protein n=1 Tax=Meloidogyne enterolobii TaxID=390850 RepID=A0ACB1ARH5_MELEN